MHLLILILTFKQFKQYQAFFSLIWIKRIYEPSLLNNMSKSEKPKKHGPGIYDIRGILKQEFTKNVSKREFTKDVSHLKDKLLKLPALSLTPLPTEIDHLKKLQFSTDYKGLPHSLSSSVKFKTSLCTKESCLEFAMHTNHHSRSPSCDNHFPIFTPKSHSNLASPELIERAYLGNPTGRQDIKNLSD